MTRIALNPGPRLSGCDGNDLRVSAGRSWARIVPHLRIGGNGCEVLMPVPASLGERPHCGLRGSVLPSSVSGTVTLSRLYVRSSWAGSDGGMLTRLPPGVVGFQPGRLIRIAFNPGSGPLAWLDPVSQFWVVAHGHAPYLTFMLVGMGANSHAVAAFVARPSSGRSLGFRCAPLVAETFYLTCRRS